MPTSNPRLTITLPPGLAVVLRRLSELAGNSQSAVVGELLQNSQPVFERMVRVLEAAERVKAASREAKEHAMSEIVGDLESMQGKLERQLGLGLDLLDGNVADLAAMAERIERRGGRRAGGGGAAPARRPTRPAPATPMSNRGVTTPSRKGAQKRRKQAKRSAGGPV